MRCMCPTAEFLCLQRFFSATLQNFATQSLLMAVGVGARKALAASAAINWMLKDGMNRLVRMGVATQFGDSFDSDLKVRATLRGKAYTSGTEQITVTECCLSYWSKSGCGHSCSYMSCIKSRGLPCDVVLHGVQSLLAHCCLPCGSR